MRASLHLRCRHLCILDTGISASFGILLFYLGKTTIFGKIKRCGHLCILDAGTFASWIRASLHLGYGHLCIFWNFEQFWAASQIRASLHHPLPHEFLVIPTYGKRKYEEKNIVFKNSFWYTQVLLSLFGLILCSALIRSRKGSVLIRLHFQHHSRRPKFFIIDKTSFSNRIKRKIVANLTITFSKFEV